MADLFPSNQEILIIVQIFEMQITILIVILTFVNVANLLGVVEDDTVPNALRYHDRAVSAQELCL